MEGCWIDSVSRKHRSIELDHLHRRWRCWCMVFNQFGIVDRREGGLWAVMLKRIAENPLAWSEFAIASQISLKLIEREISFSLSFDCRNRFVGRRFRIPSLPFLGQVGKSWRSYERAWQGCRLRIFLSFHSFSSYISNEEISSCIKIIPSSTDVNIKDYKRLVLDITSIEHFRWVEGLFLLLLESFTCWFTSRISGVSGQD